MPLATSTADRITSDKVAIMRCAHSEGRFALRMCRTIAERQQQPHWLRKASKLAKAQAVDLRRHAEEAAAARRALAARAAQAVALVASYGGAGGIRQEIEAEHYRQHFNAARIETLRAALSSIGA
jgi:hypothetical protein